MRQLPVVEGADGSCRAAVGGLRQGQRHCPGVVVVDLDRDGPDPVAVVGLRVSPAGLGDVGAALPSAVRELRHPIVGEELGQVMESHGATVGWTDDVMAEFGTNSATFGGWAGGASRGN